MIHFTGSYPRPQAAAPCRCAPAAAPYDARESAPPGRAGDRLTLSPAAKSPQPPRVALITEAYGRLLGRPPEPQGLADHAARLAALRKAGATPAEVASDLEAAILGSEEYRGLHPEPEADAPVADAEPPETADAPADADAPEEETPQAPAAAPEAAASPEGPRAGRDAAYIGQPNGWTCAPTSLSMALADFGLRPANQATVSEMVRLTGANANVGLPGGASLVADSARRAGAQSRFQADASAGNVRAALERGHGVVINGAIGKTGHFAYIQGLAPDGRFIVADPYRPGLTRMTNAELQAFANTGPNPRGFAEIWR